MAIQTGRKQREEKIIFIEMASFVIILNVAASLAGYFLRSGEKLLYFPVGHQSSLA